MSDASARSTHAIRDAVETRNKENKSVPGIPGDPETGILSLFPYSLLPGATR